MENSFLSRTADPVQVIEFAVAQIRAGYCVGLATVIARRGSTPCSPGQKIAHSESKTVGTIGGGAVEYAVLKKLAAMRTEYRPLPRVETFQLGAKLGMCCGGSVDVLLEQMDPRISVLIVGAGHIGTFTSKLLKSIGFRVVLCDARPHALDEITEPNDENFIALSAEFDDPEVLQTIQEPSASIALVMTHDHQLDQNVIEWALQQNFAYVGGVGSRAKSVRTRERLIAKSFAQEDVDRVRMPIGVDIGARTPEEIGVSIVAELVAWRSQRSEKHL